MNKIKILELDWNEVRPDENQPRLEFDKERLDAMSETFKQRGQINPACVRVDPEGITPYIIIDGENRWRVGSALYKAYPNEPLFAKFKAYLKEIDTEDLLVEQYIFNSGQQHTPYEKIQVMRRLYDAGFDKKKLRSILGIAKMQYRDLKEFMSSPSWLHEYGKHKIIETFVYDEGGNMVLDESGRPKKKEEKVKYVNITHLAVLTRYAKKLVAWDRKNQQEHPDGEYQNVAKDTICGIADRVLKEQLSVLRLSRICANSYEKITQTFEEIVEAPSVEETELSSPFEWEETGVFKVLKTDPQELTELEIDMLVKELESLIIKLKPSLQKDVSKLLKNRAA